MWKKITPFMMLLVLLAATQISCREHELTQQEKDFFEQLNSGNSSEIARLIQDGMKINIKNNHGNTPLHMVSLRGDCESIKLLLNKRAKINSTNNNGDTPLHRAATNGRLEAAKLLIEKCANVNAENNQGKTPVFPAAHSGNIDLVKFLVSKGATIQTTGYTPLHEAVRNSSLRRQPENSRTEMVEYFLSKGVDVNAEDDNYMATPLYLAVKDADKEVIDLFIKKGATVDTRTKNGETPLCNAALGGNLKAVEVLLDNGADVNVRDKRDYTPLHYALLISNASSVTMSDRLEVVKLLLSQGADINARDNNQYTPFFYSIQLGLFYKDTMSTDHKDAYLAILKTLLEKGADVNENIQGRTPIFKVAMAGDIAAAKVLVDNGANINFRDNSKNTPLHVVVKENNMGPLGSMESRIELIQLLLTRGADVNAQNNSQYTPLHNAVAWGWFKNTPPDAPEYKQIYYKTIIQMLLENRADPNVKDRSGRTALKLAEGEPEIIELLIKYGAKD